MCILVQFSPNFREPLSHTDNLQVKQIFASEVVGIPPGDSFSKLDSASADNREPAALQGSLQPFLNKALRKFLQPNPTVEAVIRHSRRRSQLKRLNPFPSTPPTRPERPLTNRKSNPVKTCEPRAGQSKTGASFRGFCGLKPRIGTRKAKGATERPRESGSALDPQRFRGSTLANHESGVNPPDRHFSRAPR